MKKKIVIFLSFIFLLPSVYASNEHNSFVLNMFNNDARKIKSLLHSQVRYANKNNFNKFIATYDSSYKNSDGFDLSTYSTLVKDIWDMYDNIEYGIKIQDITIDHDTAKVEVQESSEADIMYSCSMDGTLHSESKSVYYLKKNKGVWKVISDDVLDETTTMLYGDAKDLDIKLSVPNEISGGTEYTASLEFEPPHNSIAIASIAMDKIEYPQKQPKEVYRRFPDDNILERLFIANKENLDEYVIATIGLTKADISEDNIKLSLTGYGYKIRRVNVLPKIGESKND